jgi:sulfur-oxidizing protein SoxA
MQTDPRTPLRALPVFTRLRALPVFPALVAALALALPVQGAQPKSVAKHVAPLETRQPASARPWHRYQVDSQGSRWPQTDWSAYSNVANLHRSPPKSPPPHYVTPIEGDAERGRALAYNRRRGGSCVVCHIMGPTTPSLPGNVGPDLSQIGATRTDEWLFNYVYDARNFNENTIMPPWGAHRVFHPGEIKDIVAFLKTLKTPYQIKDAKENPNSRPVPVEERSNLDPTENPAMFALDKGKALFGTAGPNGKSCASCHADPSTRFKTWAGGMPYFEPRLDKVLGTEEFITRHARATTGAEYLMQSEDNIALSIYLRNLANGTPINPDVSSPGAKKAIERAKAVMRANLGQLNMACNDCHTKEGHANQWVRGQYLVEFKGTVAHFPTWRTSRGDIWDIRKRFQWCNVSIRADELPPDAREYGDIEFALALINKGEKINAPGIRH